MATEVVSEVKQEEPMVKILIGVPILAWTHEFACSFLNLWTDLMTFNHQGKKFHVGYKFEYRKPVHMAEEALAQLAVDSDCTHLLLMDDDIYDVTAKDVMKLVDSNKDVVGGIMHASGFPYAMCAFRRYDTDTKVADQPILKGPTRLYEVPVDQRIGLQKVDLIPFGFTLIKVDALKKLKKPWFTCDNQAPTDSWFADSALNAGLEYYANFDVWLNHRGVTKATQPHWMQIGLINSQKNPASAIVLSPEEMQRHEVYMKMKLAESEAKVKEHAVAQIKFHEKEAGEFIAQPIQVNGVIGTK
jgi:hypothetical protein